jgi:thiol-disulfide isomerase/thioredoxin
MRATNALVTEIIKEGSVGGRGKIVNVYPDHAKTFFEEHDYTILGFMASWCPFSSMVPLYLQKSLERYGSNILVGRTNVDNGGRGVAELYDVDFLPSIIVLDRKGNSAFYEKKINSNNILFKHYKIGEKPNGEEIVNCPMRTEEEVFALLDEITGFKK